MNTETVKRDWTEIKAKIKTRFGKLTDESIDSVKGNLELLSAKLQSAYGYAKDHADQELKGFKATLDVPAEPDKKAEMSAETKPAADEARISPIFGPKKVA